MSVQAWSAGTVTSGSGGSRAITMMVTTTAAAIAAAAAIELERDAVGDAALRRFVRLRRLVRFQRFVRAPRGVVVVPPLCGVPRRAVVRVSGGFRLLLRSFLDGVRRLDQHGLGAVGHPGEDVIALEEPSREFLHVGRIATILEELTQRQHDQFLIIETQWLGAVDLVRQASEVRERCGRRLPEPRRAPAERSPCSRRPRACLMSHRRSERDSRSIADTAACWSCAPAPTSASRIRDERLAERRRGSRPRIGTLASRGTLW